MSARQLTALATSLVVLVVAAVMLSVRDDEPTSPTVPLSSPAAVPTEDILTPSAAPATSPTPTAQPAPAAPAPNAPIVEPEPPGEVTPAREGTYAFRETRDGETSESHLRVTDLGPGLQEEVLVDDGVTSRVRWGDGAKLIEVTTFGEPPNGFDCDWDPDLRELTLPLSDGASWEVTTGCQIGAGVRVDVTGSTDVVGTETVDVGGQDVATWKLTTRGSFSFTSAQGSFERRFTSDDNYAPRYGLYVRSVETSQEGDGPTEKIARELLSLEPTRSA